MKGIIVPIGLVMCVANYTYAADKYKANKYSCLKVEQKIYKVDNKLRNGYKVKQGEALKKELRQLKSLKRSCRLKNFKTE